MSKNLLRLFSGTANGTTITSGDASSLSNSKAIVKDFAMTSDINVSGLRRAKKDKVVQNGGKKQYQMEVFILSFISFNTSMSIKILKKNR
jgi:hypothetical protein